MPNLFAIVLLKKKKESEIAFHRFLAIPSKVFIGRPTITYKKKNGTHPAGEGTY